MQLARTAVPTLVACATSASAAWGQALGPDGSPITTNQYSVDLTRTPVLDSTRVTGLGGAFVAIAEGVDGNLQNPAAGAQRQRHSFTTNDYDWGIGITFPTTLTNTDFFNTGRRTDLGNANQDLVVFFTPALTLNFGKLGISGTVEYQSYGLTNPDEAKRVTGDFTITHIQGAYGFLDGQLLAGGGARIASFTLREQFAVQEILLSSPAVGVEVGALLRPTGASYRIGASFRSTVATLATDGTSTELGDPDTPFYTPEAIRLPWDVNVGFAYQIGERPFNARWRDPDELLAATRAEARRRLESRRAARARTSDGTDIDDDYDSALDDASVRAELAAIEEQSRRSYQAEPRAYVLVSASLVITGDVEDSVGIESFLSQTVHRSGESTTYSPRLGVEAEPWAKRLKFRVGSYLEPTRFRSSSSRLHGTLGVDVNLLPWTVFGLFPEDTEWRLSGALDYAARYLNWGVSLGIWH